ncbi:MAG: N-acetylneuraminate synthase [Bacteroidetes bacterium]|nr:N-acetylneuraminate synthase [Bacteroidota bacterium]
MNLNYKKPKVVSEIGCNHKGDFEIAKELIKISKECDAEYVKFQKRNNKELLSDEQYNAPHPNPHNSYGKSYGEHRENLEFSVSQHKELKSYCESIGVEYSTSVWDVTSAKEIIGLNPNFIKVPSACNLKFSMLEELRDRYDGNIQLSVGMTNLNEIENIVKFFEETNQSKERLMLYSCTSGYPVPPSDVCLLEVKRLLELYRHRVESIGFSGHHNGIALDIAAYTLGAEWIERHFTKDRTWKGTDHAASLEPAGLKKLVRDLNSTYSALKYKGKEILDIEKFQRDKLKSF